MLLSDVDMLVDNASAPGRANVGMHSAIGEGCPRLEVGQIDRVIGVDKVPASKNTDNHVIQAPLRDRAVEHGNCEVRTEVAVTVTEADVTSHGHVQTSEHSRHTSGSCLPI